VSAVQDDGDDAGVHGVCAPGFEPLRAALGDILTAGAEVGAALAVSIDGEPVVDLWAGHADGERTRAWRRDTIVNLYSIGKAVTAICLLRLVEAGRGRSRRSGRALLARVRPGGEGAASGALSADASGWAFGRRPPTAIRGLA